jgi:ribosomal protein S18 acetylase RimI-like enzyme
MTLDRPFAPAQRSERVVALGEGDADELGELMRLGYRNRWDDDPAFDAERVRTAMRDWGRGLPNRCSAVVGIRDGGDLVAFGAMRETEPSVQLVDQVVTSTDRRGEGLAREVIRHCLAIAPPEVATAEAGISATNDASLGLFTSLGFTEAAREYIYAGVIR